MRLNKYLIEEKSEWVKDAARTIQRDCKPWLSESRGRPGWRASKKVILDKIKKVKPRNDRAPMSTNKQIHEIADKLFNEYWGWKARSNVVFIQGNIPNSGLYGPNIYAIYPIGKFKYLWSQKIRDLWILTMDLRREANQMFNPGWSEWWEYIENKLKKAIKDDYQDIYLSSALSRHGIYEVMVNCKEYYLIPEIWHVHVYTEMYGEKEMMKVHA